MKCVSGSVMEITIDSLPCIFALTVLVKPAMVDCYFRKHSDT